MDNDAGIDDSPGHRPSGHAAGLGPVVALCVAALALPLVLVLVVVCAVIPVLPWWLGVVLGLAAAGGFVAYRLGRAYPSVLGALSVAPATPDQHPRFHNIAQGLSLAGGVSEPDLYVVDDEARNAAAVARGSGSAIVATSGLLAALDRIALEAVVAECLVRIGSGDAEAATVGAALFGPLLSGPTRPLAVFGMRKLLASDRDLMADRAAVALTRYPPGLSSALQGIAAGPARVGSVPAGLDHVWLVPPSARDEAVAEPFEVASLTLRLDVLGEL